MFDLWLSFKLMRGGGKFLGITSFLSIIGLVIGVGVLIATMAVVSGFEKTIRSSVVDLSGHMVLLKRGTYLSDVSELKKKAKEIVGPSQMSPFLHAEAMIPHKGTVSGVVVQGIESDTGSRVPLLKKRIIKGQWLQKDKSGVVIGKEIAKRMNINLGDRINIVVPKPSKTNSSSFQPRLTKAEVLGFIDLGKFEYNDRIVIADNRLVQKMLGLKIGVFSGLRIMLPNADMARVKSYDLATKLGYPFYTKNWYQLNRNFFEALKIEKRVIFLVLSIMILAASFNTASSLFISVVKRYAEISVLKALGAGPNFILKIFGLQGVLIGFVGTFFGILFGFALIFVLANYSLVDIPADIYKIDRLPLDLRAMDVVMVGSVSFVISFLASLIPAYRGSKLSPMEGLRYE